MLIIKISYTINFKYIKYREKSNKKFWKVAHYYLYEEIIHIAPGGNCADIGSTFSTKRNIAVSQPDFFSSNLRLC